MKMKEEDAQVANVELKDKQLKKTTSKKKKK